MTNEPEIIVEVDTKNIDAAIEKANRLVELLQEAQQIIDSLDRSENYIRLNISDCDSDDIVDDYINRVKADLTVSLNKDGII